MKDLKSLKKGGKGFFEQKGRGRFDLHGENIQLQCGNVLNEIEVIFELNRAFLAAIRHSRSAAAGNFTDLKRSAPGVGTIVFGDGESGGFYQHNQKQEVCREQLQNF